MTDKLKPTSENILRIKETYNLLTDNSAKFALGELFTLQRKLPTVDVEKNVLKLARKLNFSYQEAIYAMGQNGDILRKQYSNKSNIYINLAKQGILASSLYELMEEVTDNE